MADIAWPPGLPQRPLQEGFARKVVNQTLSSPTGRGRRITRAKFTGRVEAITATYAFTAAQYMIFQDFFFDALGGGPLSFDWPDPDADLAPLEVLIVPETDPEGKRQGLEYLVTLKLETVPC